MGSYKERQRNPGGVHSARSWPWESFPLSAAWGPHFAYVHTNGLETTKRVLATGYHSFQGESMIYQRWIQGFNPRIWYSLGLIWSMWISFLDMPVEYQQLLYKVAEQVVPMYVEHRDATWDVIAKFCVSIDLSKGWTFNVVGFIGSDASTRIPVHYQAVVLKCTFYENHQHGIEYCPKINQGIPTQGVVRNLGPGVEVANGVAEAVRLQPNGQMQPQTQQAKNAQPYMQDWRRRRYCPRRLPYQQPQPS